MFWENKNWWISHTNLDFLEVTGLAASLLLIYVASVASQGDCLPQAAKGKYLFLCLEVLVAQLCPNLWDPMDHSPPGSSVHGIFQIRILKWIAISHTLVHSCNCLDPASILFKKKKKKHLFIHLAASGTLCLTWSLSLQLPGLPRGTWDLSSLTRDRAHVPCIARRILNYWTAREARWQALWCEGSDASHVTNLSPVPSSLP